MFNNNIKTMLICNCISTVVAFLCITVAAIAFGKIGILWFYLIPMFMSITSGESKKEKKND